MLSVRQWNGFWLASAALSAVLLIQGCANSSLARFAPPGFVKYEDIAGEKPPNPVIQESVRNYQQETRGEFPVLSETPSAGQPPERPPDAQRDAALQGLVEQRDVFAAELEADRAAADADLLEREKLSAESDSFAERLEGDLAAARAERQEGVPNTP